MKKNLWKYLCLFMAVFAVSLSFVSCGDDDDDDVFVMVSNAVVTGLDEYTQELIQKEFESEDFNKEVVIGEGAKSTAISAFDEAVSKLRKELKAFPPAFYQELGETGQITITLKLKGKKSGVVKTIVITVDKNGVK